jgi:hypothetical protein
MELDAFIQSWRQPEVRAALGIAFMAFAIWRIPVLGWLFYPFYLFGVFIHEISHGLIAILTGGRFLRFEIAPTRSGVATVVGGSPFLVSSAGYLGTAVLGGILMALDGTDIPSRTILLGLGVIFGLFCLAFVRNLFGIMTALLLTAGFFLTALRFDTIWTDTLLWLLAVHLFLYTFTRLVALFGQLHIPNQKTDAHVLAQATGIPPAIWIVFWFGLTLGILFLALNAAYKLPPPWELLRGRT